MNNRRYQIWGCRNRSFFKSVFALFVLIAVCFLFQVPLYAADLEAGKDYQIEFTRVTDTGDEGASDCQVTKTAIQNSEGDIVVPFTCPTISNNNVVNFHSIKVTDTTSNKVVRKGFVPAPCSGTSLEVGINPLSSTVQDTLQYAFTDAGSDSSLMAAFLLTVTRSQTLGDEDKKMIAKVTKSLVLDDLDQAKSIRTLLVDEVGEAKVVALEQNLICNSGIGVCNDLSCYAETLADANDVAGTDEDQKLADAGGLLADLLTEAAYTAGIPPAKFLSAFERANAYSSLKVETVMESGDINGDKLNNNLHKIIDITISSFRNRMKMYTTKKRYENAMEILNADADLSVFNDSMANFATCMTTFQNEIAAQDRKYHELWDEDVFETKMEEKIGQNGEPTTEEAWDALWREVEDEIWAQNQAIMETLDNAWDPIYKRFDSCIPASDDDLSNMTSALMEGLMESYQSGNVSLVTFLNQMQSVMRVLESVSHEYRWDPKTNTEIRMNWPVPQVVAVAYMGKKMAKNVAITYEHMVFEDKYYDNWDTYKDMYNDDEDHGEGDNWMEGETYDEQEDSFRTKEDCDTFIGCQMDDQMGQGFDQDERQSTTQFLDIIFGPQEDLSLCESYRWNTPVTVDALTQAGCTLLTTDDFNTKDEFYTVMNAKQDGVNTDEGRMKIDACYMADEIHSVALESDYDNCRDQIGARFGGITPEQGSALISLLARGDWYSF